MKETEAHSHIDSVYPLRKAYAYFAKTLVLVGVALDGILHKVSLYAAAMSISKPTAIGFASVLTNSEVIFKVRDMSD